MTATPAPGRRSRWTVPILAAAGIVLAVVAVVLLVRRQHDGPGLAAVASLPPAAPGVVSVGYVGSHWRLTSVTDDHGTIRIPGSVDAWLELQADGELLGSDDVNVVDGHYVLTRAGFDVSDAATTLAGYGGNDPVRLAAITGIAAMVTSSQPPPSASAGPPPERPVHVTVLSADRGHLTVQAGGMRLSFLRTGPARPPGTPIPLASSAPIR